jgi:hypothetical protein
MQPADIGYFIGFKLLRNVLKIGAIFKLPDRKTDTIGADSDMGGNSVLARGKKGKACRRLKTMSAA